MKIKLNKKSVKNLNNSKNIPVEQTPNIAGGYTAAWMCQHSYPVCYTEQVCP
ncbi:hypothetical protein PA25_33020 [Pseudoalteromonas sp. A25]|uniref:hypothetical protein n=1 Tax=Pseudoalteromonas sp. A25 TaxID=116092 RepID=UPI0012A33BFD|nr:hypothetical protein [Pseudoalteromonas sp. A25]BBN83317.1 hypothetical protein PA25_33020 [Pseudoalteromonas sp. A25]